MLLAREELLLLQASLTCTSLAAQRHLGRAGLSTLQMLVGNVSEGLDEGGVPIQALGTLDARAVGLMHDLQVQLIQGLDMIAGEGNGHEDQVGMTTLDVLHDSVTGLGSEPCTGAHLRLPTQPVRVAEVESLHHSVNGRGHLSWVWVACRRSIDQSVSSDDL